MIFHPPSSLDFNSTEHTFSKLEALPRATMACGEEALWAVVGAVLDAFTPHDCAHYFTQVRKGTSTFLVCGLGDQRKEGYRYTLAVVASVAISSPEKRYVQTTTFWAI